MMVAVRAAATAGKTARLVRSLKDYRVDWRPLDVSEMSGHTAGLNFSRSWALWSIFEATGDQRYRESFQAHVSALLAYPRYWNENYYRYAHWVAQFGIYAIALTYGKS
jgi:hypothetical protein